MKPKKMKLFDDEDEEKVVAKIVEKPAKKK